MTGERRLTGERPMIASGTVLVPLRPPPRDVELTIDGGTVRVPEGATILDACRAQGKETPTICYLETLHPVNVCRVCVVEVEGSRVLVPSCSRPVEPGYGRADRFRAGPPQPQDGAGVPGLIGGPLHHSRCRPMARRLRMSAGAVRSRRPTVTRRGARQPCNPGHHAPPDPAYAATVAQPVKVDNELYVRDYGKCVLCYKCVEACGKDYQNTYALTVAGRGFDARISTEFAVPLARVGVRVLRQLHRGVPHRAP